VSRTGLCVILSQLSIAVYRRHVIFTFVPMQNIMILLHCNTPKSRKTDAISRSTSFLARSLDISIHVSNVKRSLSLPSLVAVLVGWLVGGTNMGEMFQLLVPDGLVVAISAHGSLADGLVGI